METQLPEPDEHTRGTVTRLLAQLERGDPGALEEVFPLVYSDLREIAHRHRSRWQGDSTLGTTALVNETYLRLVGANGVSARSRLHFLRIASRAMRQILANYGRDRKAFKRGAGTQHVPLDGVDDRYAGSVLSPAQEHQLTSLMESLARLEEVDHRLAEVVECRFFGGLSIEETAEALGVSPATVKRDWALARAWLYREMTAY